MNFKAMNFVENVDYVLIPSDEKENSHGWDVRILTGDYVETVVRYGVIKWDGDNQRLSYNYDIISSPIEGLEVNDDDFQERAITPMLACILEVAAEKGQFKEQGLDEIHDE
jgi:hypothetical protein